MLEEILIHIRRMRLSCNIRHSSSTRVAQFPEDLFYNLSQAIQLLINISVTAACYQKIVHKLLLARYWLTITQIGVSDALVKEIVGVLCTKFIKNTLLLVHLAFLRGISRNYFSLETQFSCPFPNLENFCNFQLFLLPFIPEPGQDLNMGHCVYYIWMVRSLIE